MGITKEAALKILKLDSGSGERKIIQHFKVLSLEHFPVDKTVTEENIKNFGDVCQAAAFLLDYKYPETVKLKDMLSFFQFLFFKSQNENEDSSDEIYEDSDDEHEEFMENCKFVFPSHEPSPDDIKNEIKAKENAKELILEEERARKKAEKKKSQKKKRKEKKKKEKQVEQPKQKSPQKGDESSENSEKVNVHGSSSESEDDIDTNSAFVAVVAKKKKNVTSQGNKKENNKQVANNKPKSLPLIQEDPMARTFRSRQLAVRGNEMASSGHFNEAIELFSEAIKIDPSDHRFYGNRSYCFDKIGNYDRALQDANKSIEISPTWAKGHYRKGKALASLRNLIEADVCFAKVLELDPECEDAVKERYNLKVIQIMEMGFSKIQAELALEKHKSMQQALDFLLTKYHHSGGLRQEPEVYLSDDDDEISQYFRNIKSSARNIDEKMDPSNPEGHNSIWVGNIQADVTEAVLKSLFSRHGELLSIRLMHESFCAFINYKNPQAAGMAMRALQGIELCGANLLLRFPEKNAAGASAKSGVSKTKIYLSGDECYFWRTTGCSKGPTCKFKHIPKNKGIDIDKVIQR